MGTLAPQNNSHDLDDATSALKHQTQPPNGDFAAVEALTRLLVGGTLEGSDELLRRVRQWEASATASVDATSRETRSELLRYALVGMLFETEAWTRIGLRAAGRISGIFARLARTALPPILNATPAWPLVEVGEMLARRGQDEIDRWILLGRDEERRGRALAQRAMVGAVEEALDYAAHNPEVRALVAQQGASLAGTAVDAARGRAVSADTRAERVARRLLRRPAREQLPEPPADVQASTVPNDNS